jgi:hypothetical protein
LLLLAAAVAGAISGCGEVSLSRKYKVPISIYTSDSAGAVAVVNIELPIDIKKQPDVKPNIPVDITVPLIPKDMIATENNSAATATNQFISLPAYTGNLIIIWSAKRGAAVPAEK